MRFLTAVGKVNLSAAIGRRVCNRTRGIFCSFGFSTEARNKNENIFDVVISGGGIVGTAMAAALGSDPMFKGKRVLLLEAAPNKQLDKLPEVYRSRTCALNAGSVQLLESIGAWEKICGMRVKPVEHMQVWDCCSDSMMTFHKSMETDQPLAYIVENDVIVQGIVECLQNLDSGVVDVRYNARVNSYKLPQTGAGRTSESDDVDSQWAQVILDDGQILRTRLLIGADGIKSLVRQSAGIHTIEWNYWQTAVVATLTVAENGDNTTAWQRFLPDGPIALLPLSNKHCCLIWSTSHSHAKQLVQLSAENFVDAVNYALCTDEYKDSTAQSAGQLINSVTSTLGLRSLNRLDRHPRLAPSVINIATETIGKFPLGLGHATHYTKPRVALIGDAAHRVHPLAGQGVNLGFGDVTSLRHQLVSAISIGSDIGSVDHLLSYETERQRVVVPMMASCDVINRLYSNRNPLFVLLRSVGCQTLHSLTPVKDLLMKVAVN